ncbi:MAG: glutamate synthase central domain-containing protein, partial [Chloroflexota bacterium]
MAEAAIDGGASIVVLSDRDLDGSTLAVPMLLAVGTLHHHLIRSGKRMMVDIVADCGEVADVHVLACLVGYGASAVCPWMALNAASEYAGTRGCEGLSDADLRRNYLAQLDKGFLKVSSKMGISTATGYRGAQIFETIGLSPVVVERSFTGTPARLGGVGMAEIAADTFRRHREAFAENAAKLPDLGFVRYRKDGEPHGYEPPMVKALQAAVNTEDRSLYAEYRDHV